MARKRIVILADVVVYRDAEWNEYSARYRFGDALFQERTAYYTDDKEDAIDTAHQMQKDAYKLHADQMVQNREKQDGE